MNLNCQRFLGQKNYSCCPHAYPRVIIRVRLRRRYVFYMVNLVVPCSLIALMVLLSFILPPESGERIGLGITVLMAMAIFQELTSAKLPVDSENMPLLGNNVMRLYPVSTFSIVVNPFSPINPIACVLAFYLI